MSTSSFNTTLIGSPQHNTLEKLFLKHEWLIESRLALTLYVELLENNTVFNRKKQAEWIYGKKLELFHYIEQSNWGATITVETTNIVYSHHSCLLFNY